ncbi:glycosyltransferase family 2 protein [Scatolibacter rhodanostii]|uniref:glycosyltransferase family 2 protein n=1 Tax=Scatolibacter rhodanostii TaxID=2014781 RepID=UPI000C0817E3|nr:glycosyltransferase family A protein [Scatolibacter rhodanostii]
MAAVTVFTPTYNRSATLERLYRSLQEQINKDFEWLVVDDGSSDQTESLLTKWEQDKNDFAVRYIQKENGGKHTAINLGIEKANGKLFFIVDSDDYLLPDAIEKILQWEKALPSDFSIKFCGVAGARGYTSEKMIGTGSGKAYADATSQRRSEHGISGDKAEAFYTDILRQFPFPVFPEERFVSESIVWFALGKAGYHIRWYDDIIYIGEYLEDGLTYQSIQLLERNPRGYLLALKSDLENLDIRGLRRLGCYAAYERTAKKLGQTTAQIAEELGVSKATLTVSRCLKSIKDKILPR